MYDLYLDFAWDENMAGDDENFFRAVHGQSELRMEKRRGPVEVVIIDQVDGSAVSVPLAHGRGRVRCDGNSLAGRSLLRLLFLTGLMALGDTRLAPGQILH